MENSSGPQKIKTKFTNFHITLYLLSVCCVDWVSGRTRLRRSSITVYVTSGPTSLLRYDSLAEFQFGSHKMILQLCLMQTTLDMPWFKFIFALKKFDFSFPLSQVMIKPVCNKIKLV